MSAPDAARAASLGGGPAPVRRRRSRARLALLLAAFVLLAGELVVRAFDLVDPAGGAATPQQAAFNAAGMFVALDDAAVSYANRPGATLSVAGIEYRHDARGWRELPGAPPSPGGAAPATVAFLGDSTCYGLGLPAADTLPALVQSALGGRVRALNLGTCGYTTAQEAAQYAAAREALGEARLVVLLVFPNDFAPGAFLYDEPLRALYVDPLPLPRAWKPWLFRSALYRGLVSWRGAAQRASGAFDPLRPENHEVVLAAVARLAADVRADGRRLLVAHLPAMERLDPYAFAEPVAKLRAQCERLGVPFTDLLEPFLAERERQAAEFEARSGQAAGAELRAGFLSQFWIVDPHDHHLNAAANRIAAGALAEAVERALR
jgi:lysophospholipase L1-like esterase